MSAIWHRNKHQNGKYLIETQLLITFLRFDILARNQLSSFQCPIHTQFFFYYYLITNTIALQMFLFKGIDETLKMYLVGRSGHEQRRTVTAIVNSMNDFQCKCTQNVFAVRTFGSSSFVIRHRVQVMMKNNNNNNNSNLFGRLAFIGYYCYPLRQSLNIVLFWWLLCSGDICLNSKLSTPSKCFYISKQIHTVIISK